MPAGTEERGGVGVVAGVGFGGGLSTVEVEWVGEVIEGASTECEGVVVSVRRVLMGLRGLSEDVGRRRWRMYILGGGRGGL